jgi:hypothetical protein
LTQDEAEDIAALGAEGDANAEFLCALGDAIRRLAHKCPQRRATERRRLGLLGELEHVGDGVRELLPVLFFFSKLFPAFGSQTIVAGAAVVL